MLVPLALGLLSAMARSYISRQYDTTVVPHDTRAGDDPPPSVW